MSIKRFSIRKPNGKLRYIYAPDLQTKRHLKSLVPQLNLLAEELDVYKVQHGFTEARSPVTNAKVHIGFEYSVCFDLKDFFDTVSPSHIFIAIPKSGVKATMPNTTGCFVDGAARQGLPTSPALANIAASPMDREFVERFCAKGRFTDPPTVYSRYADDLTFSCRTMATVNLLLQEVPKIVHKHGFVLNPDKTRVQCSTAGRRIITGVAVGPDDVYCPREVRRRIRAAQHQVENGFKKRGIRRLLMNRHRWRRRLPLKLRLMLQMEGLKEWAMLKLPENYEHPTTMQKAISGVVHAVQAMTHCQVGKKVMGIFGRKFS